MKAQHYFTANQADEIIELLEEKVLSSRDRQKAIRLKIRKKFGFFISDFKTGPEFEADDFDQLIRDGIVVITDDTAEGYPLAQNQKVSATNIIGSPDGNLQASQDSSDFKMFDPLSGNPVFIPDVPGFYLICMRQSIVLPGLMDQPQFSTYNDLRVLYIGVSNRSLRKRDFIQHFNGNAGNSTLRKSLGVLFGYKLIPRDRNILNGKTKFCNVDEQALSNWMKKSLLLFYAIHNSPNNVESMLIRRYNPPLNLKGNYNPTNKTFRDYIRLLRSSK